MPFTDKECQLVQQAAAVDPMRFPLYLPGRPTQDSIHFLSAVRKPGFSAASNGALLEIPQRAVLPAPLGASDLLRRREWQPRQFSPAQQQAACFRSLLRRVGRSTLPCHEITDLRFHPSLPVFAVSSVIKEIQKNELLLYDLRSGTATPLHTAGVLQRGHLSTVASLAFDRDGDRLFSCSFDGTVRGWDVASGEQVNYWSHIPRTPSQLDAPPLQVDWVVCSPTDSALLASCGKSQTAFLWDVRSAEARAKLPIQGPKSVEVMAFTCDSAMLLGATLDASPANAGPSFFAWDVGTGAALPTGRVAFPACFIAASRYEQKALACGADRTVRLIDLREFKQVQAFPSLLKSPSDFNCASFSACETYFQASGEDNNVLVYDVRNPRMPLHVLPHERPRLTSGDGTTATFLGNSLTVASGGDDGIVRVWDIRKAEPQIATFAGHQARISAIAATADGFTFASGGDESLVQLYSIDNSIQQQLTSQSWDID